MKALAISIIALVISIFSMSMIIASMDPGVQEVCYLEVKYIIFNSSNNFEHVEVVDKVWINGNIDFNNRPFRFRCGSKITVACPEYLNILGFKAKFTFWQREEGPTYQGVIVANRTLTIVLDSPKQIWWANYVVVNDG